MFNKPFILLTALLSIGILIARYFQVSFILLLIVLFSSLIISLVAIKIKQFRYKNFFFCLSVILFGMLLYTKSISLPPNHIVNFNIPNQSKIYIAGKINSEVLHSKTIYNKPRLKFNFDISACKIKGRWFSAQGLIQVIVYGERSDCVFGNNLLLEGVLSYPAGLRNPGGFNYREFLKNKGIRAILKVKRKNIVNKITALPSKLVMSQTKKLYRDFSSLTQDDDILLKDKLLSKIFVLKQYMRNIIDKYVVDEKYAGLLKAIVLGDRHIVENNFKDVFIKTGSVHILAISGLHIGLVALLIFWFLKLFKLPHKVTYVFSIFILLLYVLLTGSKPPTIRAAIMLIMVMIGFLIDREIDIYNCLGMAAFVLLILNPAHLFNAGFQLSFTTVISIIYFSHKIEDWFNQWFFMPTFNIKRKGIELIKFKMANFFKKAFSVSFSAWIGSAPLVAYHFNIVSPSSIITNIIMVPLLFLVVIFGIILITFGFLIKPIAIICAGMSSLLLKSMENIACFFSKIPLAYFYVPSLSIVVFAFIYITIAVFHKNKAKLILIILLFLNLMVWYKIFVHNNDFLEITFLDVGSADSMVVKFPNGEDMLIDTGRDVDARWVVSGYLRSKGINNIEYVVLTHPHSDHIGGINYLLDNFKVGSIFDNGIKHKSVCYKKYIQQIKDKNIKYKFLRAGNKMIKIGDVNIYVLNPSEKLFSKTVSDVNNNSLVLKIVYGKSSILLLADVEADAIRQLLSYGDMLKTTILKYPHHGQYMEEAGIELIDKSLPKIVVISKNFRRKAAKTIQLLINKGTKVYTTSKNGAISVKMNKKGDYKTVCRVQAAGCKIQDAR